jgi:hypothetical protein
MQYWILKSGMEIFDLARAYGLATLLADADEARLNPPIILDDGHAYRIEMERERLSAEHLERSHIWEERFHLRPRGEREQPLDPAWRRVFITTRGEGEIQAKVVKVKGILEKQAEATFKQAQEGLVPSFDSGESLPGGLEPSSFKGLKGRTRGHYSEGQTFVDELNWALACLGGALAGRYVWQGADCFVVFPVPDRVSLSNYLELREKTLPERLRYLSALNAAAHYALLLAKQMRTMATSQLAFSDRFSSLIYFSLLRTGAEQWKPTSAGRFNLEILQEMALAPGERPPIERTFQVWHSLFRRGSVQGNEDLAVAITEFIAHPTLETYKKHVRVLLRHIAKGVKMQSESGEWQVYDDESIKEAMSYVTSGNL